MEQEIRESVLRELHQAKDRIERLELELKEAGQSLKVRDFLVNLQGEIIEQMLSSLNNKGLRSGFTTLRPDRSATPCQDRSWDATKSATFGQPSRHIRTMTLQERLDQTTIRKQRDKIRLQEEIIEDLQSKVTEPEEPRCCPDDCVHLAKLQRSVNVRNRLLRDILDAHRGDRDVLAQAIKLDNRWYRDEVNPRLAKLKGFAATRHSG